MGSLISKKEARAFRDRWRLVNAREVEEMRSTRLELKWQQFKTLLEWGRQFAWTAERQNGEAVVRERWARLRKALLGQES